jgi:DNA-binding LacI/PurR family transcriptional regulator
MVISDDGAAAVTLDQVARAAGVSRSTASRALTGTGHASTPAGRRVLRVAEQLGYVPNPVARALARGFGGTRLVVAVAAPGPAVLTDPYLARVVSGAAVTCGAEGLGVALEWLPLHAPGPALARLAADRGVRGVVLVNTTPAVLAAIPAGLRGRVVSIGVGAPGVPSVDVDKGVSAADLVRHLVEGGRRRIVMIVGPSWLPCAVRPVDAYRSVVRAAGLPARTLPGDFSVRAGRAGAIEALRRWPDTDAVFGICDATALGALAALRGLGRDVPGDVAVAGSDDVPFAALSTPALTTATHPVEQIGGRAALAVLSSRPDSCVYPSELVLRESA